MGMEASNAVEIHALPLQITSGILLAVIVIFCARAIPVLHKQGRTMSMLGCIVVVVLLGGGAVVTGLGLADY